MIIYAVIARAMGVAQFGVFSFAMSIAIVAMVVIEMGQNRHASRVIARSGGDFTHVFIPMTLNKFVIGAALAVGVNVVMTLGRMSPEAIWTTTALIGWATILGAVDSARAILKAVDRMGADSVINAAESLGRLVAVAAVLLLHGGIIGLGLAFLAEALVAAVAVFIVVSRQVQLVPRKGQWVDPRAFLRESVGIGLAAIASAGFYRIDQVFVYPLAGEVESGLYGAAARVAFTAVVAAGLVSQAAFPRLAAVYEEHAAYRRELLSAIRLAVMVGGSAALAVFVFAKPVIVLLYGEAFADAVVMLRVLTLAVAVNGFTGIALNSAHALHREKKVLPRVLAMVAVVSALNMVFVPRYGAIASAWISAVGEALLAGSILWVSRDRIRAAAPGEVATAGRAVVPSAVPALDDTAPDDPATAGPTDAPRVDRDFCISSYLAFRFVVEPGVSWVPGVTPVFPALDLPHQRPVSSTEEVEALLGELIEEAVATRSAGELGVFLSGGIDSAIVAAMLPQGTKAFTVRFVADGAIDESQMARRYAETSGLDLRVIDVTWQDYVEHAPTLMRAKRQPLHAIEVGLYKAACAARDAGVTTVMLGAGADVTFGGLDGLIAKDWTFDEFVARYTVVEPEEAVVAPISMLGTYEKYRTQEGIDYVAFVREVHGQCTAGAFENPLRAAGCGIVAPFEHMRLGVPLDVARVRAGEPKYMLTPLFRKAYPGIEPPRKIPFARPMDIWLADWPGPTRPEFREDLDIRRFVGDRRWILWCLEAFLNRLDAGEI